MLGSAPICAATVKEQLFVGHNCHTVLPYGERGLRRKHIISLVEDLGDSQLKRSNSFRLLARRET